LNNVEEDEDERISRPNKKLKTVMFRDNNRNENETIQTPDADEVTDDKPSINNKRTVLGFTVRGE